MDPTEALRALADRALGVVVAASSPTVTLSFSTAASTPFALPAPAAAGWPFPRNRAERRAAEGVTAAAALRRRPSRG